MPSLAPEPQLRAALRVLFTAACSTRNWTCAAEPDIRRIYALWEAIHEIPDLVVRWRSDSEAKVLRYLDEYDSQFGDLHLRAGYLQAVQTG